jgi:midasin
VHTCVQELHLFNWQLPMLESMSQALSRSWMVLLVGGPGCGKTKLARLGARVAGRTLIEVPLTSGTDTSDLLGR